MGQEEKHIAQTIYEIAHKGELPGKRFPVMSGKVVAGSVDMDACTCAVILSVDDDAGNGTPGILLNAVSGNVNGVLCFPADDSNVWVAEIDGHGKWGIVKTSELTKMVVIIGSSKITVIDGTITFNNDSLGGLVKVEALVSKINRLETALNNLKTGVAGAVVTGSIGDAGALKTAIITAMGGPSVPAINPVTDRSNIENTAVKHG